MQKMAETLNFLYKTLIPTLVLISEGNSGIGAQYVWRYLGYLICLRHLIRSKAVLTILTFLLEKTDFPSYVRNIF